jgi:hypothetical protein
MLLAMKRPQPPLSEIGRSSKDFLHPYMWWVAQQATSRHGGCQTKDGQKTPPKGALLGVYSSYQVD